MHTPGTDNRVEQDRAENEGHASKKLFCKGTSVSILCILCSPPAPNSPNYFSCQSAGLQSNMKYTVTCLGKDHVRCAHPVTPSLTACLISLSKVEIQVFGLDPYVVNSDFFSFSKIHPLL